MKIRVPLISEYYNKHKGGEAESSEDLIHKVLTTNKELEIIAMIFDAEMDIYNFRISKNTPDVEVRYLNMFNNCGIYRRNSLKC
jgi:hypothetical protein